MILSALKHKSLIWQFGENTVEKFEYCLGKWR